MSLETYRKKRTFTRTPEPAGGKGRGSKSAPLRFVVQKHQASHLHYDFRLEAEGVLKSWAIPKGPSMNPQDKRLAMMVEDHPWDYRGFEGNIPAGNYGAGSVIVWDEGTYEAAGSTDRNSSEQAVLEGLADGHLSIVLQGKKLQGEFSLVQMKGRNPKTWLLIKKADDFASAEEVDQQDRSVLSGRTVEEVAENQKPKKSKLPRSKPAPRKMPSARRLSPSSAGNEKLRHGKARRPAFVTPMLATLVDEPFDRAGWRFEVKWDGFRAIAEVDPGNVRLYSRNQESFLDRYPAIAQELASLPGQAILDGEIVAVNEKGVADFQLMQNYLRTGAGQLLYYVFDLLERNGRNLRQEPLRHRQALLKKLVHGKRRIRFSTPVETHGQAFFQAALREGAEGIMAKDEQSKYLDGRRSHSWLKIKTHARQEAVIAGFTEPQGARQRLGALVLGVYEGKNLVYIGHTGGGFNQQSLEDLHAKLRPLEQRRSPFREPPKTNTPVHWVEPKLVCEVKFQEWTRDGRMRQPIFLGLRPDKQAAEVVRERPEHAPTQAPQKSIPARTTARQSKKPRASKPSSDSASRVELTNLDKIYWPEEGYTKGDLIEYYRRMAPLLLPYLHDRPMNLLRHPNGITGTSFFQKDVGRQKLPDFVETASIRSESTGETKQYLICQNVETLLFVANLGCIELNPWNARVGSLERPDYLVFDLDPVETPFSQVVQVARALHALLEELELPHLGKTSGKRGLHVYVPLGGTLDHAQARGVAEVIARRLEKQLPEVISMARSPQERRRRVYIDFLQNKEGTSMAAPYSVRPTPQASVSTPLQWKEVTAALDPTRFTLQTMPRRVDRVGDLWKPVLTA
jgi:bifunctional non-homologous end joining protein LigD